MRFSLLIEETDAALADKAEDAGYTRAWLAEGVDPSGQLPSVVPIDPEDDPTIPPIRPIGILIPGTPGWEGKVAPLLADDLDLAVWVRAENVGAVAAAGRAGVGVLLPELDSPEDAEEFVSEYFGEFESDSASAIGDVVNPLVAVQLSTGDDAGELTGLIERYRQAGVDEVILTGPNARGSNFVAGVIAEFDDPEVEREVEEKAQRLKPTIERMNATEQPVAPPEPKKQRGGSMARRAKGFQDSAVRKMSDRQINMVIGNRAGIRMLFGAMARIYDPAKSKDFTGDIEFALKTPHGVEIWTIHCSPDGASASKGETPGAKLHVKADLADFLRVGVGQLSAPKAVLTGKLDVRGDFGLALRMNSMFGGKPIV
jgi:hypothetical protein